MIAIAIAAIIIIALVVVVFVYGKLYRQTKSLRHMNRRMARHMDALKRAVDDYRNEARHSSQIVDKAYAVLMSLDDDVGDLSAQISDESAYLSELVTGSKNEVVDAVTGGGNRAILATIMGQLNNNAAGTQEDFVVENLTAPAPATPAPAAPTTAQLLAALQASGVTFPNINQSVQIIKSNITNGMSTQDAIALELNLINQPVPATTQPNTDADVLTAISKLNAMQTVVNAIQGVVTNMNQSCKSACAPPPVPSPAPTPVPTPATPVPTPATPVASGAQAVAAKTSAQVIAWATTYITSNLMTGQLQISATTTMPEAWMPTYIVDSTSIFMTPNGLLGDIYDNGLVLVFAAATGMQQVGSSIAASMMSIMTNNGWVATGPDSSTRTDAFQMGLPQTRYNKNLAMVSYNNGVYFQGDKRDLGNIAVAGLGLAKFGATFGDSQCLNAALDLALTIHNQRYQKCPNFAYYMARTADPTDTEDSYASFEHHIDLYALATMLLTFNGTALKGAWTIDPAAAAPALIAMQSTCQAMADYAWDASRGCFRAGTSTCSIFSATVYGGAASTPVDTQTWMTLSGISAQNHPERIGQALTWAVSNVVVQDADVGTAGCADPKDNWPAGAAPPACSTLPPASVLTGTRFSDAGAGIHWENTGSGVMALLKGATAPDVAATIVQSIATEFSAHQGGGMYSSFQTQAGIAAAEATGWHNTGFSWSYYKVPHTASTMYCALGMAYAAAATPAAAEVFNPYSPVVNPAPGGSGAVLAQLPPPANCPFKTDMAQCPVVTDVGVVWGNLETQPTWFDVSKDKTYATRLANPPKTSADLANLQYDRNLMACDDATQLKTISNMYKTMSAGGQCPT